jgi:hypothetical protein
LVTRSRSDILDLVSRAREKYQSLPPIPLNESISPETFYRATPSPIGYAFGWILASAIVDAMFESTGVDVLPVFHPENGWDRFLITRRVTGAAFQYQPANEYGMLILDSDVPLTYTSPGGKPRVNVSEDIEEDVDGVVAAMLKRIDAPKLGNTDDTRLRDHEKAPNYPNILRAITELVVDNPGLVAAREIYIDDEEIDGQYHPLYLHAAELTSMGPDDRHGANVATTTYRWFQLQIGELFAFIDKRGNRTVYRTERGTWSRVKKQLADEDSVDEIRQRIEGWLRLNGRNPNPEID